MSFRVAAVRRKALLQAGVALTVVFGTILAAGLLDRRVVTSIEQSRLLVARANLQADALRRVVQSLWEIRSGERSFVLTGDAAELAPYTAGTAMLQRTLDSLRALSADTPGMQPDLQDLAMESQAVLAEAARILDAFLTGGRDKAAQEIETGEARQVMQQVRATVRHLLARNSQDHETHLRDVRAREALAARGSLATAAFCAVLLGFAILVLLRNRVLLLRTQAELGELTSRLSGSITHLRDGIAVFGEDGGLLLWNEHFATLARLPSGQLRVGEPIERILATAWPHAALRAPSPNESTGEEIRSDELTLEIWRGVMPDGGQIVQVVDATRRNRAEEIARQAQKMEALGQLTGGVAHDFNNLLQVISANLELVGLRAADMPRVADRLKAALAATDRAAQLTRHLLAFARRQPLAPVAIDTAKLLTQVQDMLSPALGEGIELEMRLQPGLWPIRADPQQLETAIVNLAINGRDAMGGNGRLTISASNEPVRPMPGAGGADLAEGRYVAIAIADTGVGMSAEELTRALEPFYTTKAEGRGTGLGLPMVFGFAKQSNGHLQLSSRPGVGTVASLTLPVSEQSTSGPPAAVEGASPRDPSAASTVGELILIAEDDAAVRTATAQALRDLGYRVAEAEHPAGAMKLLNGGLRPDLLFTDVVMPGPPDIRSMVAEARRLIPDLAVVYTTGYAQSAIVHGGEVEPGVTLIRKPWRSADLARTLRQALSRARDERATGAAAGGMRPLRVLLVEDDELIRAMTAELLGDFGHQVTQAGSGAEALQALEAGADLLVTDLQLPDIDGVTLADRACVLLPELAVVVASGQLPDPRCAYVWLAKPYDSAALRDAIDRAVAGTILTSA